MKRLILDGQTVPTTDHEPLDGKITLRRQDTDGRLAYSYAGDIRLTGNTARALRAALIDNPNPQPLRAEIYDDCCQQTLFVGLVAPDRLDWCDGPQADCTLSVSVVEDTPQTAAYNCLQNTLVTDNRLGFQTQTHPFVRHCVELRPNLLMDLVIVFGMLFNLLLFVLVPLVAVISVIIAVIAAIPGVSLDASLRNGILDEYIDFLNQVNNLIIGCQRGHISPYVRSYIDNACRICGLSFQSSLFTDPASPYYHLAYFSAPIHKGDFAYRRPDGTLDPGTVRDYFARNAPIANGLRFLDDIARPFAATYWLEGNTLHLEPGPRNTGQWIDVQQLPQEQVIRLCYSYEPDTAPAYATAGLVPDYLDVTGNEALPLRYQTIIDYNQPVPNPARHGERVLRFNFGPARFRQDGLERDVLETYRSFPFVAAKINDADGLLLLSNHLAGQPKLLDIDPASDPNYARVRRTGAGNGNFDYNQVMWLTNGPDGLVRFHLPSATSATTAQSRRLRLDAELRLPCPVLAAFSPDGYVQTPYGPAQILELAYGPDTVTLSARIG